MSARPGSIALLLTVLVVLQHSSRATAQQLNSNDWIKGPARVPMGTVAEMNLPVGFWCLNQPESIRRFAELTQNSVDPDTVAVVVPDLDTAGDIWFIEFSFDPVGYVRDDEKGQLTKDVTDAILKHITDATAAANAERQRRGWESLYADGWHTVPFFNDQTKNLTWAVRGRGEGSARSVNYTSRLLGRGGVMCVSLVASQEQVTRLIPTYENLTGRVSFVEGQKYSEFRSGDKVAAYGLTALATGGTAVIIAKSWKGFIALGAGTLAVLGGIARWCRERLRRLFQIPEPVMVTPGPVGEGNAQDTAPPVMRCPQCGQNNRLKLGQLSAKCGRCGASLL